jgi:hypothetical protein
MISLLFTKPDTSMVGRLPAGLHRFAVDLHNLALFSPQQPGGAGTGGKIFLDWVTRVNRSERRYG